MAAGKGTGLVVRVTVRVVERGRERVVVVLIRWRCYRILEAETALGGGLNKCGFRRCWKMAIYINEAWPILWRWWRCPR